MRVCSDDRVLPTHCQGYYERQLAGLESLEQADVMYYKEGQDIDNYTRDIAFDFLNDAMFKLTLPKAYPPYPGGAVALALTKAVNMWQTYY